MPGLSWRHHVAVLAAYAFVALVFSWPLVPNLATHLPGPPTGDTGVYVWNQWVFRHELVEHRHLPYLTDAIFGAQRRANLSLHNYTTFQNLLALPLIGLIGVVATFNVVYLLMTVLTAYATFLLATHVTNRMEESWLAGLFFAWSPVLVARGMGHFSLVAAAPLPLFLLVLLRADGHERLRDAVALGACVWLAASTDVYYAVYCLLIGLIFVVARVLVIERSPQAGHAVAIRWALDVLILCVAGLVASMLVSGGWQFTFLGRPLSIRSYYTPVLVLTVLVAARALWRFRAAIVPVTGPEVWRFVRYAAAAGVVAAVLLSPVLFAAAVRLAGGQFDSPRIFWRSSPPGVDVLAFFLPNPNHPLAPDALVSWLTPRPDQYAENVASVPWIGIAVVLAAWRTGWLPSRWWAGLTLLFGLMALGPFVHVAHANTYVPGPWAVLRYIPLVGLARTPGRFTIVAMLGCAMLFAAALAWIARRYPDRRRAILVAVAALLVVELFPAPRPLYSAAIPRIYDHVARAPGEVRVLELPFGFRDGTQSVGNFTARSQFFQTAHGKTLLGGYLSRLSRQRMEELRSDPVLNALAILSENRQLREEEEAALLAHGPALVRRYNVGFVVIDRAGASDDLRETAVRALRLSPVDRDGMFELYRPVAGAVR